MAKLAEVGVKTKQNSESVRVMGDDPLIASDMVTEEYPGFPTDMQAQFMALATQAEGTSIITENISRTVSCTPRNLRAWEPTSKSRADAPSYAAEVR